MTGILTRLVARANGRSKPRLAPRIPGRFEASSNEGRGYFEIINEKVSAAPPADAVPQDLTAPDKPLSGQVDRPVEIPVEPSAPTRLQDHLAAEERNDLRRENRAEASTPKGLEADTAFSARPERPARVQVEPREAEFRASTPAHRFETDLPAPLQPELAEPPKRFLPVEPRPAPEPGTSLNPAHQAPARVHRVQPDQVLRRPQPQELPEIVINIGQIDVKTEPAKAGALARRPAKRPQMTPLGDYLKSGGRNQ